MNESRLQKIYNYSMYPKDSKIYSDKGFVNVDNGSLGCTYWTCFIKKKITDHTILIALEQLHINFFSKNYLNQ